MKFISELNAGIRTGMVPDLTARIYENGCNIIDFKFLESIPEMDIYSIELIYESRKNLNALLKIFDNSGDKYVLRGVRHSLEDKIRGGFLKLGGKVPLENMGDYNIQVLGARDLINEKIAEGKGADFTGVSRNIGLIAGFRTDEDFTEEHFLKKYTEAETDSIIISRFTEYNPFPVMVKYPVEEDFIKTLQKIEHTFSALRFTHIDGDNIFLYEQIVDSLDVPVVFAGVDDVPMYLLAQVKLLTRKNRLKFSDTTIGFLGVDKSVLRLTSLLGESGCGKILGFDNNERIMLSFENKGGLATTGENILQNSDVLIIMKDLQDSGIYDKIRPGQYIISLLDRGRLDMNILAERGIRGFKEVGASDFSFIVPSITRALAESGFHSIPDSKLIEMAFKLATVLSEEEQVDYFTQIHETLYRVFISVLQR